MAVNLSNSLVKEFAELNKSNDAPKETTAYGTVYKDSSGIYVTLDGSSVQTPASTVVDVETGNRVTVIIKNHSVIITGNISKPADASKEVAQQALSNASLAQQAATQAQTAANEAIADAAQAQTAASNAITDAGLARDAATQAQTAAGNAVTDAREAGRAASNASMYAARALGNLSTVQSVYETLMWITEHGTMTITSDQELDPTHVYFVLNDPPEGETEPHGDYQVGNHYYDVVSDPVASNLSSYYELGIDESLNNYVATHLALDGEGLWIIPDTNVGNKILISTGSGSVYTDPGTYVFDENDSMVARFGEETTIGKDDGTQNYIKLDYHSLKTCIPDGRPYFHISDLRDKAGVITYTEEFNVPSTGISVAPPVSTIVEVSFDGVILEESTENGYTYTTEGSGIRKVTFFRFYEDGHLILGTMFGGGPIVTIKYIPDTEYLYPTAYTFGYREENEAIGIHSVAEGVNNSARGIASHAEGANTSAWHRCSHAEGLDTISNGVCAHAEGEGSRASGLAAHAQNFKTAAKCDYQTAIGKYNDNKSYNAFEIGNGTSDNDRSNAFVVDWNGIVSCRNPSGTFSPIFELIYPVGSIYMSVNSTNPETLFGGSWERIQGRFLVGAGTNGQTGNNLLNLSAGAMGGETKHTLKAAESGIRAHGHGFTQPKVTGGAVTDGITGGSHRHDTYRNKNAASGSAVYVADNAATGTASHSQASTHTHNLPSHTHTVSDGAVQQNTAADATTAHNNLPPYLSVYIWKRTA